MRFDDGTIARDSEKSQLDLLMEARGRISSTAWFGFLGRRWAGFDDVWVHRIALAHLMSKATRAQLNAMMTAAERTAWKRLPPILTVYRGAHARNRLGLSWSLNPKTAAGFPTQTSYASGSPGLATLYTGRVAKRCVVLKSDEGEDEVIAPAVRIVAASPIRGGLRAA
jgi:hypothetical protein